MPKSTDPMIFENIVPNWMFFGIFSITFIFIKRYLNVQPKGANKSEQKIKAKKFFLFYFFILFYFILFYFFYLFFFFTVDWFCVYKNDHETNKKRDKN